MPTSASTTLESVYREVHERSAGIDYTIYNAH
jgi:hypothetical protein